MGIVKDIWSGVTGGNAAKKSANALAAGADEARGMLGEASTKALDLNQQRLDQSRGDLQPFAQAGANAIGGLQTGLSDLQRLVSDPNAQKEFITNNPFFDALAERSTNTLLNNQAAKGKVGSGGTAEALQESILLLGSDLLNRNIQQRQTTNNQFQGLVNTGASSANAQAGLTNSAAARDVANILDMAKGQAGLRTDSASAQAAGIVGKQRAFQTAADNYERRLEDAAKTAASFVQLCDRRAKKDIKQVGYLNNGLPVYTFSYIGSDKMQMNVMAQDVEKVNPSAVMEHNGMKYVNMEAATWQ